MNNDRGSDKGSFWKSKSGITTFAFLGIAGILLIFEHRVHMLEWMPYLPYLLLLACPLLHVFMHGGHSGHGHGGSARPPKDGGPRDTPGN